MRLMSFAWTTPQLLDGTKTVTRRMGWMSLKPGDRVCAVTKAMGLKKGERVKRLAVLDIVSVRRTPLDRIGKLDVEREGFPLMGPSDFVQGFANGNRCARDALVTRIEFRVAEWLPEGVRQREEREVER